MAVSIAYSIQQILSRILPTFRGEPAVNSDTVGLRGGGFATEATDAEGFTDATFYDAAGTVRASNFSFHASDSKIAQLTNGNLVLAGTHVGGSGVDFAIDTAAGASVTSGAIVAPATKESNADVAALAGGGFVVVDQSLILAGPPADNNIVVHLRSAAGTLVTDFAVDTTSANDRNASVAGLADGGFAVAWDRTDAGGRTSLYYAVYNADGSPRLAATLFDGGGSINARPNVTALQSGGFAIGYEDNASNGAQPDITVADFNASGAVQNVVRASSLTSNDSGAAVTTLSNGLVMSTFTNDFGGGDFDIRGTLVDPTGGVALTDIAHPLPIAATSDVELGSSVSATVLARFIVSDTDATTRTVDERVFQLVRTVTGTTGADSFTGDDAVDVLNGGDGDDTLSGAANDDVLRGGNGNDLLNGGTGADLLVGGAGNDTYFVDNAGDQVVEDVANGNDTVVTSVSYTLQVGSEVELLRTFGAATTTPADLTGNEFANTIVGNAAANALTGRGGNDTLSGLGGADTFVYGGATNFGRDTIGDFVAGSAAGHDIVSLARTLFADFAAVSSHAAQVGTDTVITFDAADTITLQGVLKSSLVAGDFAFT